MVRRVSLGVPVFLALMVFLEMLVVKEKVEIPVFQD